MTSIAMRHEDGRYTDVTGVTAGPVAPLDEDVRLALEALGYTSGP